MAFVPARGGSKGLPRKNLAEVGGVSLVRRAVSVAREVSGIDEVLVSSDDEDVLAEARASGAAVERRAQGLATDTTSTVEVLRDYLDRHPAVDRLVLLQPTSPLRNASDVTSCLEALAGSDCAVSVTLCDHPPSWTFHLTSEGYLDPMLGWSSVASRRQDAEPAYRVNGAVYALMAVRLRRGGALLDGRTVGVPMPRERAVDIDDETDLLFARLLADRAATRAPSGGAIEGNA